MSHELSSRHRNTLEKLLDHQGHANVEWREVISLLKSLGLFRLFLGVETNAVLGLKTLGRGIERRQNHEALPDLYRLRRESCLQVGDQDHGVTSDHAIDDTLILQ